MVLRSRDRRLWIGAVVLLLIAVALGVAYCGSRSAPPVAAPTPTPTAIPAPTVEGLWRIEGHIADQNGAPIEGVCLAIGPVGCQPVSPQSGKDGNFRFDLPVANVDYDFHFTKAGFQQLDLRIHPTGPTTFDLVLKRG